MRTVKFFEVHLDRCPRCMGLWLDRGELEMILAQYHRMLADAAVGAFDLAADLVEAGSNIPGIADGLIDIFSDAGESLLGLLDFLSIIDG